MDKLKVFFHTDFSCAKTGFATNARLLLSYLYKTGKYELIHFCCSSVNGDLNLIKTPWKSIGVLPKDDAERHELIGDGHNNKARLANYGQFTLDAALKEHKPDVYIGQQDFWAFNGYKKEWWNKFPCVIHTTIDSLPILDLAQQNAHKIKNLWVWSEFAEKAFHELGYEHVKTVHGAIDENKFYKLSDKQKSNLRKIFSIDEDTFVIGFVFRNQLRKSIPHLLEAFKIFKEKTNAKSKLLIHTCFTDSAEKTWDIPKLIKDIGVDNNDVLATHVCHTCFRYIVKPFVGEGDACPYCGAKGEDGLHTPNTSLGVDADDLNEIYNLMDVYCHPFTSGGQEIPVQEAKLAELLTLVTNYSCGEDLCHPDAHSLPLDWEKDWETNTNFIKARTKVSSIVDRLISSYEMTQQERNYFGKNAREWVIKNYSINKVGKMFEEFLDSCEKTNYDFSMEPELKNPEALIIPIKDNKKWLKELYLNILNMDVDDNDDGLHNWLKSIENGVSRNEIENYFRNEAIKENQKILKMKNEVSLRDLIGFPNDKKILYVVPESIGDVFMTTSLFQNIKEKYPDHKLIVATKPINFAVLKGNELIDSYIPYNPVMDREDLMIGYADKKGFVDVYIFGTAPAQRFLNYVSQD